MPLFLYSGASLWIFVLKQMQRLVYDRAEVLNAINGPQV